MRALITGVTGQDGSYLAELLVSKGYEVHGTSRREAKMENVTIHPTTYRERELRRLLRDIRPDEIYNLAAHTHWADGSDAAAVNVTALLPLRLLQICATHLPSVRFYQAGTSEMFGRSPSPQNENSAMNPQSLYGASKVFAHNVARQYRTRGLYVVNGLLFNHESPRRDPWFVTRKITKAAAAIRAGTAQELVLGALTTRRDWGWAPEYVEAMWRMMQQPEADDYVIATGVSHSVEEFVALAFSWVGLDWHDHVRQSQAFVRPLEINELVGDTSHAARTLSWQPKVGFEDIVRRMVIADVAA